MTNFVDTNVLVHARDASVLVKQQRAYEWLRLLWEERRGRLSYQVRQEFYVTVTRKLTPGLPVSDARDDVRSLLAWEALSIDSVVVEAAWVIPDRFRFSWWDSLIVAAAQVVNCDYVLSEDLRDDQRLDGITVIDPFRVEPPD